MLMVESQVFAYLGNKTLVFKIQNETYIVPQEDATVISKINFDFNKNKTSVSIFVLLCQKVNSKSYLGLVTIVCNSISLTSLFITVSLYLMKKSVRSKVAISIPQVSSALFCAQLIFQVKLVLKKWVPYLLK